MEAYRSRRGKPGHHRVGVELNIGEACTELAFRWIVPLYFRADTAKQFAIQRSYAYSGCGWWHVKQNINVVTAMVDAATRTGDGGTVEKYQNETCSSCGAGWNRGPKAVYVQGSESIPPTPFSSSLQWRFFPPAQAQAIGS